MHLEFVSYAPHGFNIPETVVLNAQFLPDTFDMGIHRAGIAEVFIALDRFQQLFPGKNPSGV